MNLLDLGILAWVGVAAFSGFRRGAALQLVEYVGLLGGLVGGAILAPHVVPLGASAATQSLLALVVLIAGAALGQALGWAVGRRVWSMARRVSFLGSLDSVAGALVSVVAVLLATWFVAYNLSNGPFPTVSNEIRTSAIVQGLDGALPRPPNVLSEARRMLNRFGFPEVFADLPPAPAGPVPVPSGHQAAEVAARIAPSTVRITGDACGMVLEGSGFVGAPHYVVTNAHVVAGAHDIVVTSPDHGTENATVVLFDPKIDLAVLRVAVTPGPVLRLDPGEVGRGQKGAVLGYPGGGPLAFGPAAVRRQLDAVGRDIYGNALVTRTVYELQAVVRPGNSGGPLVSLTGEVIGVVFAASTTDPNVGYALTSVEALNDLHRAAGRTAAVSTQACTG